MSRVLLSGNEAAVQGALVGGCTHFYGYPITPASEIVHAAARYFPQHNGVFLQAESEVSAINMVYGASSAGVRVMSASSGPGIALMGEGLSYLAGARLPAVIVDIQRAGPGLGNIWPEQSDYNMVVKGGGHGNYSNIVLAPASVQEMFDFTKRAFEIADRYRMTVFILSDAYIGQMMEMVSVDNKASSTSYKEWALYGDAKSRSNLITSIYMSPPLLQKHNEELQATYKRVEEEVVEWEELESDDAKILLISYGISSRICYSALTSLRNKGVKVGLLRPKTLFPFPKKRIAEIAKKVEQIVVVEMSSGQMGFDVEHAVQGVVDVKHYQCMGGVTFNSFDLIAYIEKELV